MQISVTLLIFFLLQSVLSALRHARLTASAALSLVRHTINTSTHILTAVGHPSMAQA